MNVALLGAGQMGRNHFRVLRELSRDRDFDFMVYDPNIGNINAKDFAGIMAYYMSEDAIFEWADAAVIAAPTSAHKDLCLRAIENGAAVLCEKPLADNPEDVVRIGEAAEEKGTVLMAGFTERYNPAVRALLRVLDDEEKIGSPLRVDLARLANKPPKLYKPEGVVMTVGVHDYDLLVYLFGPDIDYLTASAITYNDDLIVFCQAEFYIDGFVSACARTSWIDIDKRRTVTVYTDRYVIEADLIRQRIRRIDRGDTVTIHTETYDGEPLWAELETFIGAAKAGSTPPEEDRLGLRAVEIANAIINDEKDLVGEV